jgi:hypothetical protein
MKFLSTLSKMINTGQSRTVVLTGNIYDLFFDGAKWVPLTDLLQTKTAVTRTDRQKGITQIIWRVNRAVEVIGDANLEDLSRCWARYHNDTQPLSTRLAQTLDNRLDTSIYTFELLRQLTECSRKGGLSNNLVIVIEAADMLLPEAPVAHMMLPDRKRVSVAHDWFGSPEFVTGHDTVILLAESRSGLHSRVSKLPQVMGVEIGLPDTEQRLKFITGYKDAVKLPDFDAQFVADNTSGLSIHAVNQLLRSGDFSPENMTGKVEAYLEAQLGEGVVEFKRPTHTLDDVIGFSRIKAFFNDELIPGFLETDPKKCIGGALFGGPIGGGKTFLGEAIATAVKCPVILLKNIRSKWYGETDAIFERLRRILETFHKILIFVDEADTIFGQVSSEQDVERRLTGSIQTMMSDPALKGRVFWLLMTARVHRLSPDIRRPGRMDLIIPILDPEGDDQMAFVKWAVGDADFAPIDMAKLRHMTAMWSSAQFALLRSRVKLKQAATFAAVEEIVNDMVEPDISDTRRYQTLQSLVNCTRRSLLVDKAVSREGFAQQRKDWQEAIAQLEGKGIR